MATTPKKPAKAKQAEIKGAAVGGSAAVIAKAARAGAAGGAVQTAKTRPRVDAVKAKAVRRADAVKAKIKAQVAGLDTTREARTTRVKASVDAVKAKRSSRTTRVKLAIAAVKAKRATRTKGESARTSRSEIPVVIAKAKTARTTRSGMPAAIAKDKSTRTSRSGVPAAVAKAKTARASASGIPAAIANKLPVVIVKPKSARTRIKAAVAAVKAKVLKGRRVASTEEREVAALAIAAAHAAVGTMPPTPRRPASDAGTTGAPANENAPTLSAAPLATIAPRGAFLPDRVVVDVEGDTFPRTKLDEHGRDEAILSGSAFDALRQQVAEGQRLVDGDAPAAFRAFRVALELLPEPVQNWNAAGWLLVAMGECAIRTGDFTAAFAPLKDAMHCPGTIGNPWVHLLLGRCRLELGDERAADELSRAYMGGGRALFDELDPKYFALVEHVLKPPPGHDRLP